MPQFNLQKTMLGATAFFIEKGVTVDTDPAVEVAVDAKPTNDPVTNWRTLGCVVDMTPYRQTEEDTPIKCFNGQRYTQERTTVVLEDGYDLTLRDHAEPIYRLLLGLDAEVVNTTPVVPFQKNIREIEGWLKLQARNVNADGDVWVMDLWCKMELIELPTYNDKTVLPKLRFTSLGSGLDVVQLTNVANVPDA